MVSTSIFYCAIVLPLACVLSGCAPQTAATPPDSAAVAVNVATVETGASQRQFSVGAMAYVPVAGALVRREVPRAVVEEQAKLFGNRVPLLNDVIRQARTSFPRGARVLSAPQSEGQDAVINLNAAFADPKFWRGRSHGDARLAFHALARNVAFQNEPKGVPLKVRFLVEGKRIAKIGSFDTAQPLRPEAIIGVGGAQRKQQSAR